MARVFFRPILMRFFFVDEVCGTKSDYDDVGKYCIVIFVGWEKFFNLCLD